MNSKQTRKYELIVAVANGDDVVRNLGELGAIDFTAAFEMWEFVLARGDGNFAEGLGLFESLSDTKTRMLFCESLPLQKILYSSLAAGGAKLVGYLASLILAGKIDAADECLARLRTNTHIDFNEIMRTVIDTTFATYCQKNNTRVPTFNKKQKTLLLDYINKIKGANKALLLQRMKEI